MTPERWQQIKALLERALACEPSERAALLDLACKDDSDLRNEVESLIALEAEANGFMETPVVSDGAALGQHLEATEIGRLLGPYKVVREIGHGGMGTLYLAVRADDQYKRRVAIKVIRRGMDTEQILSRFRHERQILASLDHPNIARLLDGGTTPDGLPYFVMEYIEGQAIDQYCDAHRLTTVERLKLFRTVCGAVHYAHQNLVVHRDLKPSNILVLPDGVPKLLDFGIAKLLKPELYAETIAPTGPTARLMTPDYASPEQVKGQPITTASDIYSLGVLLYELLTGHRPYRVGSRTPQELERVICEQEPERPSTVINRTEERPRGLGTSVLTITPETVSRTREGQPDKLRKKLAGDLDNIVLMAMRKEAQRRYASVEQFAEDIRRHLEGLPVIARKDTFSYRAGKFIKRHRVGVAVASLVAILMAGSIIAIAMQSTRAARERNKAIQVANFLAEIFKVSDPNEARGKTVTAREILDKGAEKIARELNDQPEIQATLMQTIGGVYETLGLYDSAVPLLRKALDIRQGLFGHDHLDVAESMMSLASVFHNKSDFATAEPLFREALAIRRKLLSREHPAIANSLNGLGLVLDSKGETEAAETVWREALAIRRQLLGHDSPEVGESLDNLGWLLYEKGDYGEAERLFREAQAIHKNLYGNEHPTIAADLNYLAFVASKKPDSEAEVESLYREALAMRRKIYGSDHPQVAESLNNLAWLMNQRGNPAEAEALYREALAMRRKLLGDNTQEVAQSLNNLAKVLMQRNAYSEAEPLLRAALATNRNIYGDEGIETTRAMQNLAELLYERRDYTNAESLFRRTLDIRRRKLPQGSPIIAATLIGLGQLLSEQGNPQAAEPLLREAVEIRRTDLPAGHWQIAQAESVLGACLVTLRHYAEAEPLLVASYAVLKAKRGEQAKETQRAAVHLVKLYTQLGKPDKLALYKTASAAK